MGEKLNGLSVNELHNIESRLEMSLRGIRTKKVIFISQCLYIFSP